MKGKYVVLGDMNGHVGRDVDGFEGVHGGNGFGDRNAEGEFLNLPHASTLLLQTHFSQKRRKSW